MSDATGPVQTGALCYFDWTCSECNRLVVAGEWHKHALIGHGVTDRALADVQILTEKVESLQSQLQAKSEECERLKVCENCAELTGLHSCEHDEPGEFWGKGTWGKPDTTGNCHFDPSRWRPWPDAARKDAK